MRIRKLVLVAAAATLPFSLSACGGASVEDFCEQYDAIDQLEGSEGGEVKDELEELADTVPDDAGDDVQEAVDFLAESFPEDGDLEQSIADGDVSEEEAGDLAAAAQTVTSYGDENCS